MKTVTYDTFGEPADVLTLGQLDQPEPGPGEVRARMVLSPIHNHDLWTIRGTYGYRPDLPAVGGSEALGVIEAVGEGVDPSLVGRRIVAAGLRGAWAESFIASAAAVVPLPDAISDTAGAQLIAMPFSALALLDFLNVSEGDWVIQTAANGAVGRIFVDLAAVRGVKVVNLVRRAGARAEIEDMDNVITTSDPDWQDQVRAIVGDGGARAAIDSVGGPIVADIADLLGRDGLLVVFGTATGEPLQLNAGGVISKHIVVKGFWGARVIGETPDAKKAQMIGTLVTLAAEGKLDLRAGGTYPLDQAREAMKAALTPGRGGKILLQP